MTMMINKYHSLDCCDSNRGIDKLFNNYQKDTDSIYNLVINDPNKLIEILWTQESPFCIDINCRCCMGDGDRRSAFSCSQCKNISKIKDLRKSELTFEVQCGINIGKQIIILPYKISNLFICYDNKNSEIYKSYMLQKCNCDIAMDLKFIRSDPFTNRILLMSVITKIFKNKKLPHTMNLYTAFICGNKGYSMLENPTIGSLDHLHKIPEYHTKDLCSPLLYKITKTIITQLVIALNELSHINFSHGNPSIESLVFGTENVSYKYDEVNVSGDITLKIVNFWKSSATFSNTRYFSGDIKTELYLENNILVPKMQTMMIDNNKYYKIGHNNINMLIAMNNSGIPIFLGSFDLYCFFVSLMCDQSFYISVIKNKDLYSLWKSIWLEDDLDKITKLICGHHYLDEPVNNFNTTINIISEFWLRCDVIKFLLVLIKKK
jgi:hypothetical protein